MSDVNTPKLAEFLVGLLDDGASRQRPSAEPDGGGTPLTSYDVDIARAVKLEFESLIASDQTLTRLARMSSAGPQRVELVNRLRDLLDSDARHAREVLLALLGQDHEAISPPRTKRRSPLVRFVHSEWLGRRLAAVFMNVLIVVPIAVAFLTVWGGLGRSPQPVDVAVVGLKVFAVWCLAFLPGWLYVRFLGQRAGALWDEFVINLHRMRLDHPRYLPRPPVASEFFDEWYDDQGPLYDRPTNLYRQKFQSYYGRAVIENSRLSNFAIRADSLFPVFLTTAILAVGWVAVLWDVGFVAEPGSVWDVLKFAFLGAYFFLVQSLFRRFFQNDLRPSAYASAVLRIIVVLLSMAALHQIFHPTGDWKAEAAVAFVVGIFPVVAIQALLRITAKMLRGVVPSVSPDYPLSQLDGMNIWYETRLLEEGIEDMQSLSTANLVDVILHTRVPVARLIDWIDQAQLYLHLDRTEHSKKEVRQGAKTMGSATSSPSLVGSSAGAGSRGGTQTRVALRQLGIRSATDLLLAFPPEQIDRIVCDPPQSQICKYERLSTGHLDDDQVRLLVRVLTHEYSLAPIWNWKSRGPVQRSQESAGTPTPPSPDVKGNGSGRRPA